MIIDKASDLSAFLSQKSPSPCPSFNSVLMASPTFFDVEYAINPFMKDEQGKLQSVDRIKAHQQWKELGNVFKGLKLNLVTIEGIEGLPDFVFTANQSFPFWNSKTQRYEILLSRMRSHHRQGEVEHFERFWNKLGFKTHTLESSFCFEGNGDALFSPAHGVVFGGFGPRTDREVYLELSHRFDLDIIRLELCSPDFYHLDTCFSILSDQVVAIQPEAFTDDGRALLKSFFPKIINIPYEENKTYFCGNCFCPDGKNVILQNGSVSFSGLLKQNGFTPIEVATNEFMKSGGSVFCLKLYFRNEP